MSNLFHLYDITYLFRVRCYFNGILYDYEVCMFIIFDYYMNLNVCNEYLMIMI